MLELVTPVRTDFSKERIASTIKVVRNVQLGASAETNSAT
jgi:hypothetical protein